MSSCERYEEGLIDLAFGAPAEPALEAHLAACAGCRARLEQERRLAATVDGVLASTLEVSPTAGFDLAVRRRVHGTRPVAVRGAWLWAAATGLAAAAALILALLLRPSAPISTAPAMAQNVPEGVSEATDAAAPPAPPKSPTVAPNAARRARKPPALAEVIVDPQEAASLQRFAERVRHQGAPSAVVVPLEAALPFHPSSLEVGGLEELPRLPVTEELTRIEPATPVYRLASGGDV